MNEELYRLLCCMLPYNLEAEITCNYSGRYHTETKTLHHYHFDDRTNIKPFLKSKLSDEDKIELAKYSLPVNKLLYGDKVIVDIQHVNDIVQYLYSIHYSFGIDKSLFIDTLFIEKT